MSFRGRGGGRGGGRGFGRGGGGRGGRGGRGGYRQMDMGPPEVVTEVGAFMHSCEGDLVCKSTGEKVPYFNAPIYLENKSQIGKVDEIFGPMNEHLFSVKLLPAMQATSFSASQKFFIDPMKLLPLMRFLPKNERGRGVAKRGGRGRGRGGSFTPRGGRGGAFTPRGGRGRGGGFRGGGGGRGRGFRSRGRY